MKGKIPALVAVLLLAGCAGPQRWYNPGHTQTDFDRDSQECGLIAQEFSRQATLTGDREDPVTYELTYNNCLYAKGWSVEQSGAVSGSQAALPLATFENGAVRGFGKTVTLPAGCSLKSHATRSYGPTLLENLFFQGPDRSYINFTFQKALTRSFDPTAFPVKAPFFLYEQGAWKKNPDGLRWALFFGRLKGSWVAGLGGFLLVNDRHRISIVLTRPLPPQVKKPLPGLHLGAGQIRAMEKFRAVWLPWLKDRAQETLGPEHWERELLGKVARFIP